MLLGGKGGCQQCTCVPCDLCTRTCQNPHTGTAFEAVFTRYFEGAEAGNTSDGYLSASGDSDTSDPYDGMDGTGPWFQEVSGSFTLDSTQTRFPCRVLVSFWRNNYVLGAATIPPASTALTFEGVFVEVSSGAVVVGDTLIVPADGEVQITGASIPLVSGGGDQSENIPLFYNGSISVAPQCESASFSIRAKIEWNTQKRQHVLYGLVRECYEDATPCGTACNGNPSPDVLYLTISNFTSNFDDINLAGYALDVSEINGTYVLERVSWFCDSYVGSFGIGDRCTVVGIQEIALGPAFGNGLSFAYRFVNSGCFFPFDLSINSADIEQPFCGADYYSSGTSTKVGYFAFDPVSGLLTGSFDWALEA